MTTLTLGLRYEDLPAAAVATAFRESGVLLDHVEVELIDGEANAWRWRLRYGAPPAADSETTNDDGSHPPVERGLVVNTRIGWVVVTGGDAGEGDQICAAREWNPDAEMPGPSRARPMRDFDKVATDLLGDALGLLGALRLRLGGEAGQPPTDAVEAGLGASTGYQEARREFSSIFRRVLDGEGDRDLLLDLEAGANQMVAEALDVGWNLGMHGGRR